MSKVAQKVKEGLTDTIFIWGLTNSAKHNYLNKDIASQTLQTPYVPGPYVVARTCMRYICAVSHISLENQKKVLNWQIVQTQMRCDI